MMVSKHSFSTYEFIEQTELNRAINKMLNMFFLGGLNTRKGDTQAGRTALKIL